MLSTRLASKEAPCRSYRSLQKGLFVIPCQGKVRVSGDSMTGAGIFNNDLLIVDRSIEAVDGKIVIAAVNSELTLKRLKHLDNQMVLMPENPAYDPIAITEDMDLKIWGVVIHVIHSLG